MNRVIGDIIGLGMWLVPLFLLVQLVNYSLFKFAKKSASSTHIILFSFIVSIFSAIITISCETIDYQRIGLPWFYGLYILQLAIWTCILPFIFHFHKKYLNTSNSKLLVAAINILLVIVTNDLLTTYLFVLPTHRRYLLLDLLGYYS
jgi:hypothetical protein